MRHLNALGQRIAGELPGQDRNRTPAGWSRCPTRTRMRLCGGQIKDWCERRRHGKSFRPGLHLLRDTFSLLVELLNLRPRLRPGPASRCTSISGMGRSRQPATICLRTRRLGRTTSASRSAASPTDQVEGLPQPTTLLESYVGGWLYGVTPTMAVRT